MIDDGWGLDEPWAPHNIEAKVVGREKIRPERELTFDHATVQGQDFSGRKLDTFFALGCRFEACRFERMRILKYHALFGSTNQPSEYLDCSFDGSRINMGFGGSRFVRCSFRNVDLRDWMCFDLELVDCVFSGRLRHSFFNGTVPAQDREAVGRERNEFRGNDFSEMELIDVGFRTGIDLSLQRLPTGPDYLYLSDLAATVRRARAEAIGWEDLALRQAVLRWINSDLDAVAQGQKQHLLRPKDYYGFGGMKRDELDAYFGLLRRYS